MPTGVVVLRNRSIRASSPKFVGPASGRLGLLVSRVSLWRSVSSAPSDLATEPRAVGKRRCAHGFGRESVGHARWLLEPGFSGSSAPPAPTTRTRAIRKLHLQHGLGRDGQSSRLVAGASRGRATPRKVFDGPLRGCSWRAGTHRAGLHIFGPHVGLAAYARRSSRPTSMSFSLS